MSEEEALAKSYLERLLVCVAHFARRHGTDRLYELGSLVRTLESADERFEAKRSHKPKVRRAQRH